MADSWWSSWVEAAAAEIRGSSSARWQEHSSWDEGWSSSSSGSWQDGAERDGWPYERFVAATAADTGWGSADKWQTEKWTPAADTGGARAGWHDGWVVAATDAYSARGSADAGQRAEWNEGADPNSDRAQAYWHGWHDGSVAAPAPETAMAAAQHFLWANYQPGGADLYANSPEPKSKPCDERTKNQHKANTNIGRAANRRLIDAIKDCGDFRSFDHQQWLWLHWDWDVYQRLQVNASYEKRNSRKPKSLPMTQAYFWQVRRGVD